FDGLKCVMNLGRMKDDCFISSETSWTKPLHLRVTLKKTWNSVHCPTLLPAHLFHSSLSNRYTMYIIFSVNSAITALFCANVVTSSLMNSHNDNMNDIYRY